MVSRAYCSVVLSVMSVSGGSVAGRSETISRQLRTELIGSMGWGQAGPLYIGGGAIGPCRIGLVKDAASCPDGRGGGFEKRDCGPGQLLLLLAGGTKGPKPQIRLPITAGCPLIPCRLPALQTNDAGAPRPTRCAELRRTDTGMHRATAPAGLVRFAGGVGVWAKSVLVQKTPRGTEPMVQ